jgi:hypothetical protein
MSLQLTCAAAYPGFFEPFTMDMSITLKISESNNQKKCCFSVNSTARRLARSPIVKCDIYRNVSLSGDMGPRSLELPAFLPSLQESYWRVLSSILHFLMMLKISQWLLLIGCHPFVCSLSCRAMHFNTLFSFLCNPLTRLSPTFPCLTIWNFIVETLSSHNQYHSFSLLNTVALFLFFGRSVDKLARLRESKQWIGEDEDLANLTEYGVGS